MNFRQNPWFNPVGDEICQLFLDFGRFGHADDFAGAVFDADKQSPARAIRKSDQCAHDLFRRGKVALEFESLALVLANHLDEIEHARKPTRKHVAVASFRL